RLQCANHLKQIGLALHNYCTANGAYPAGAIITQDDFPSSPYNVWQQAQSGRLGWSWMVAILPQIEQQNVFDRWNFAGSANVATNAEVARRDIPIFYCPSRRNRPQGDDLNLMFMGWNSGGTDYGGCIGSANGWYNREAHE